MLHAIELPSSHSTLPRRLKKRKKNRNLMHACKKKKKKSIVIQMEGNLNLAGHSHQHPQTGSEGGGT